jgi:hypothetical protein
MCSTKQLTPKYIRMVSGNNTQSKRTTTAASKHRINQEIKFLYCMGKKQKITTTVV